MRECLELFLSKSCSVGDSLLNSVIGSNNAAFIKILPPPGPFILTAAFVNLDPIICCILRLIGVAEISLTNSLSTTSNTPFKCLDILVVLSIVSLTSLDS